MTNSEILEYKKAYVELYEIIKRLSYTERSLIPKSFIDNLKQEMDKNYNFNYDNSKKLLEQNYKVETKALLVELYENYLAPKSEKKLWEEYDQICFDTIKKQK